MALILKETCCRCETITRDAKTFATQDKDYKTICKDCISDLGLEGFIKYRKSFVDPVKYEDLLRYEQKLHEIVTTASNYPAFYFDDDFDKDYTQGMGATRKTIIGRTCINPDYIELLDFPNLLLSTNDVIAVFIETVYDVFCKKSEVGVPSIRKLPQGGSCSKTK